MGLNLLDWIASVLSSLALPESISYSHAQVARLLRVCGNGDKSMVPAPSRAFFLTESIL